MSPALPSTVTQMTKMKADQFEVSFLDLGCPKGENVIWRWSSRLQKVYQSHISLGGVKTKSKQCTWASESHAVSKYREVVGSHSQTCEYSVRVIRSKKMNTFYIKVLI